jgi:hypothetical protein
MSLLIDSQKIKEAISKEQPIYAVSASNIVLSNIERPGDANEVTVTSAVAETPPDVREARERLLDLRRRAIERGEKMLSFDGLERLIDEIRGRS